MMRDHLVVRLHPGVNYHFSAPGANQFRKVPVEIVDDLFRFLDRPDQICFALSCQGVYGIYRQRKNLKSSLRHMSVIEETYLCLRLQNERWVYCTKCAIPHWCSAWHTIQSWLGLNHAIERCRSGYQIWHRPPFKGQVDLCPCKSWSFYQHQLISYLCRNPDLIYKAQPQRQQGTRSHPDIGCDEGFVLFVHDCTFDKHPSVATQIKTASWFDETSKTVRVLNRFKFDISKAGSSHLGPFGRTSSNLCLHKDTKRWLEDFFRRSK